MDKATPEQLAMAGKPSDDAIMASVRRFGGGPTYAIKNGLRMAGYKVETPWVLRQMKRLERAGLVVRIPTSYAVMIVWRATALRNQEHLHAGK